MKKFFSGVAAMLIVASASAQSRDTVIVNLARTSKIIFTVEDPEDLEILRHYDFQMLFEDILRKVDDKKQGRDSVLVSVDAEDSTASDVIVQDDAADESENYQRQDDDADDDNNHNNNDDDDDDDYWRNHHDDDNGDDDGHRGKWNRTWQTFNFDLGTNNYLTDDKFPSDNDAYAVRPWGSWYLGVASVQRTRLAKKFFLEWGLGMSWYNFKFQNDNTIMTKSDDGVTFSLDPRDVNFKKSKLSVTYLQASLVPVLDFGDHGRKRRVWDGYNHNSFRIGFGPYIGYRIASHSKLIYNDDGDREKESDRDGFHLNNFRYGARLQVGYRSTDLFFNYDLNELFQENKGPKLNAFSFGVIF